MIGKTEQECMNALKVMACETVNRMYRPDWEQRRYELARALYIKSVASDKLRIECRGIASVAIEQADIFINTFKVAQDYGKERE